LGGFRLVLGTEFVGELPDALGAVLRNEDRNLAQPLRWWGLGRGPALADQRAADDKPDNVGKAR
jgi:hypothetical protein